MEAVLAYFEVLFWHLPVRNKLHLSLGDTYEPDSAAYDGRKMTVIVVTACRWNLLILCFGSDPWREAGISYIHEVYLHHR